MHAMTSAADITIPILEVRRLTKRYTLAGRLLRSGDSFAAVDNVSFTITPGSTLGLVGESGCGKSTLARMILRLITPTSGEVLFEGLNLFELSRTRMKDIRQRLQIIFQDPVGSLNPRLRVGTIVGEPLLVHGLATRKTVRDQVVLLLEQCGLWADAATRFPHEFSGGQRQRIGIARALATRPKLIIADEPVSALDVSVQAQVVNLMQELQHEFGLTYMFIAHDLSVVHHVSDRIAVMYLGDIAELGDADQVYRSPKHPYAKALLSAVPQPDPRANRDERIRLEGDIPTPMAKPSGCSFRTRCPVAVERCARDVPALEDHGDGQLVACPEVRRDP